MSLAPAAQPVLDAAKAMLRPLVRLMIARGVTLPALAAALKEVFVDVAARDFRLDGRVASNSRISLLTGVHRKDVRAIRDGAPPLSAPAPGGLGASVLGRWLGDPAFLDEAGRPCALPRQGSADMKGFDTLVASVSTDMRPRTVLDELLRQGLAELDEATDTVRLVADAFVPRSDPEMLGLLRQNLHDHLAAACANVLAGADDRRFLERAVYYNNLRPDAVDQLESEARTLSVAALRHLNGLALEHRQAGATQDTPAVMERFRFGVFFYREPVGTAAEAPPRDRA
jgi:hypothetical protein